MKKLLALLLVMMLAMTGLSMAEETMGIIGGADGPTNLFVSAVPASHYQKAIDAGRRVNQTLTITEFSGLETGDPMADAALADLLKALAVNWSSQGDEIELGAALSGKDVLDLGVAVNGQDAYVRSDMLGGTIVVNADEIEPLANRLLDMAVLMDAMTEEDAAMLREQLSALAASFEEQVAEELHEDNLLENLNTSALEGIMAYAQSKVVPVENIIVPRMCDPAVAGAQVAFTNDDVILATKSVLRFLLDNPALLDYIGTMFGYPTEDEIAATWATAGELYMAFGIYENEAEYRAAQETFANVIREAMTEVESMKIVDGEYMITMYVDAEDQPVYATLTLPLFIEEATLVEDGDQAEPASETVNIALTYTRQTVAQGVAHVYNFAVKDFGLTIDALVNEGSKTISATLNDPDMGAMKIMDLSIVSGPNAANPGVTDIDVTAAIYDGADALVLDVIYDGEYENNEAREYVAGKLTLNVYEYDVEYETIELSDAEAGVVETIDLEVSETSTAPTVHSIVLEFSSDTAISGVDYTSKSVFAIEVEGVRVALQCVTETVDPEPSIMAGEVVRPAELTDADFSNWVAGVMEAFNTWLSNAVISLPESSLTWLIYNGM